MPGCLHGQPWAIFFLGPNWNVPSFSLELLSLVHLQCTSVTRVCILDNFPVDTGRLLLGAPKAILSSYWTRPGPVASAHRASAPALTILKSHLFHSILYWGPKLGAVFKMWSDEYQIKVNHFPWPTGCFFVIKVQYASTPLLTHV